jgi:predicted nucleotidyltransferase
MKLNKEIIIQKINENKTKILSYGVKKLSLFGSYARDEAKENSDIDLLVEFKKEKEKDYSNELDLQVFFYNLFEKNIGLCEKNRLRKEYRPYIINDNLVKLC